MSFNILNAAKGLISNDLITKAANSLGESESGILKALNSAIPSVFAGLINHSGSGNASGVLDLLKGSAGSGILSNIGKLFDDGTPSLEHGTGSVIWDWAKKIFGSRLGNIVNAVSGYSGLNNNSASSVLSIATPAVLSAIGAHVRSNNLNVGQLSSFLNEQKSNILNAVPAGYNLSSALGIDNLSHIGSNAKAAATHAANEAKETASSASKWLWPLLLLVALATLIYFLTKKGCNKGQSDDATTEEVITDDEKEGNIVTDAVATVTGKLDSVSGEFIYDLGETIEINLPNNAGKLSVGKNSTEAKLCEFLNNPSAVVDTVAGNWFDFTNVKFKSGSSIITDESMTQLNNMLLIAKGFPAAQFKVGGYTDNTGSEALNLKLSDSRAKVVAAKLKQLGIPATGIVGAEGYGPKHPVATNDTPEGRAQNRRVSVRVKAK